MEGKFLVAGYMIGETQGKILDFAWDVNHGELIHNGKKFITQKDFAKGLLNGDIDPDLETLLALVHPTDDIRSLVGDEVIQAACLLV
tara:strand:- start:41 stop:301 length:261 start_codon:yes stop_codon:yes gene_type:complete